MNRRSASLSPTLPLYHDSPYIETSDFKYHDEDQDQYSDPEKSPTKRMTISRKYSIILQFVLIICISAIIAGLYGG